MVHLTLLRPFAHLFRQGVLATVAFTLPIFLVLYFLTAPDGPWQAVLATQVLATIAVGLASVSYFTTAIWVDETGIAERGFFGRLTEHPIESIGSIVQARTFVDGAEPVPQLFVCDHEGRQLVRMRGQFWSQESMDTVVNALDVPVTVVDPTVTTSELRTDFPGLLYWFERHPIWAAAAFTASTVAVGALVVVVFGVAGVGGSF
ncbi:hypothetical protein BH10ACT7_BH10ACT7_20490 [soil metagenome]